ncbi:putative disease resistance protein RGA4 [Morella rubra]|uniref:Putative disease resistance protein RGA4 n=1 Tax=Morella rubra TaxID=262757 RepID=A0A6A1V3T2_9ROSI|nr:putative disease resistance protein RGA4 [Morella rubra]
MAEAVLFNIAESISEKAISSLGSLVLKEVVLLWGVKDELEKLQNTVSAIQAVLLDAEKKQAAGDNAVTTWLTRLQDVVYEADDLLGDFFTEGLHREMMTRDKKAKKVGHRIKQIREKFVAIAVDRQFSFENREEKIEVLNSGERYSHSYIAAEKVVGREDDKKKLIDLLLMDTNLGDNVAILPIIGFGGLGKTTLAQLLFNDEKFQNYFELKMWDYEIDKSILINLWIAQGFIKPSSQNQCLEDVANEYFMDLLWRSFFQDIQMDEFGNIVGCKMHDFMHDLAVKVSGSSLITLILKINSLKEKLVMYAIEDTDFVLADPTFRPKLVRCEHYFFKGWWRRMDPVLPSFPLLSDLTIAICPMLTFMPTFPHLERLELKIAAGSHATDNDDECGSTRKPVDSNCLSYTYRLFIDSSLKIEVYNYMKWRIFDICQRKGLRNLISLKDLSIVACSKLKTLSRGIQHLTALQKLQLRNCIELDLGKDRDWMQWQGLKNLHDLEFFNLPKLVSLPSGFQYLNYCSTTA